ncbi:hypothetical protein [Sphaerisporangium sp. TRM90804]|uniref:hypothetical protein n=1 Tax=Sphaerisporangium sp. TRM90804 TaxID=3031113 RepID=UPI00244CD058|nr:hypothetical protein [Sphaerisporangium sp. TRM90804]MDH2427232.1 hypothetical protein [Sphaerisporangium sp. TRM90804]
MSVPRVRRAAAAALLLLASFLVSALGAAPASAGRVPLAAPPVLNVHVSPAGFVIPGANPRPRGPVTFRVTAEGAHGYWWTVYKLKNGATLTQFVDWITKSASPDMSVALPALRSLYDNVEYSGGAKVYPGNTVELTQTLTQGDYFFGSAAIPGPQVPGAAPSVKSLVEGRLDVDALKAAVPAGEAPEARTAAEPAPSPFGWLQVTQENSPALPLPIDGVVYMGNLLGKDFMIASGSIPADGRLLVRNDSSQPQEAMFLELLPGATDRDIQAYFDAQLAGRPLPPRPFFDSIGGMLALSPGKQMMFSVHLPPGRYGVFSWLRIPETGIDACALGMHEIMTLR